jgi:hypothetical protein
MKDVSGRSSLRSRLGWFAMLYLAGVLAVFVLAAVLHVLLSAQFSPGTFANAPENNKRPTKPTECRARGQESRYPRIAASHPIAPLPQPKAVQQDRRSWWTESSV